MHHRRARPTLRVLQEDLNAGWGSPFPLRLLAAGRVMELHPLSELPHPIIAKAAESFGADPRNDNFVGPIASSTRTPLMEIRQSQWRGGVWTDSATGVCWLVVAGLAKGGHEDRDDFYKRVEREDVAGTSARWLPTESDRRLLKQETAARLRTQWELNVQADLVHVLRLVHEGGTRRIEIEHPVPGRGPLASVDVEVARVREEGYEADEIVVEILPEKGYSGSALLWQLTLRILISIDPPEQGWDRYGNTYSNIGEPGSLLRRIDTLGRSVDRNELAVFKPGCISHYTHREHLAGKTINGEAVRALCGVYFVPTQDHVSLPPCSTCEERLNELPT